MNIFESIILGLIQGLTEFLPVSSSGHLVLVSSMFGLDSGNITFEVFLHFATFLAVVVFFFREIAAMAGAPFEYALQGKRSAEVSSRLKYILLIIIGTIPAVIVGLKFKDRIEEAFGSPFLTGIMLIVTSIILFLTLLAKPRREKLNIIDSIIIGLAQAAAILPGISRSGSTISTAMYLGVDKQTAFNFSFLLSLPAILGAFILKLKDALEAGIPSGQLVLYLAGMITAFISGYICLVVLRKIVIAGKFAYFGIYTLIIGILTIILSHG